MEVPSRIKQDNETSPASLWDKAKVDKFENQQLNTQDEAVISPDMLPDYIINQQMDTKGKTTVVDPTSSEQTPQHFDNTGSQVTFAKAQLVSSMGS